MLKQFTSIPSITKIIPSTINGQVGLVLTEQGAQMKYPRFWINISQLQKRSNSHVMLAIVQAGDMQVNCFWIQFSSVMNDLSTSNWHIINSHIFIYIYN